MKRWFHVITLLFLFLPSLYSQQYSFQHYSILDGLSQSSVYTIHQDTRGYLWLGTLGGGVSLFDGNGFNNYNKSDGLAGNNVRAICEDHLGNLWFGTDEGLTLYNGFVFDTINSEDGLLGNYILSLLPSPRNTLWVGTDQGLNEIGFQGEDSIYIQTYDWSNNFNYKFLMDIYEDDVGRLWLATYQDGVVIAEFDSNRTIVTHQLEQMLLPSANIMTIEPDSAGNLWFGTYDAGVFILSDIAEGQKAKVDILNRENGLLDLAVWDILVDNEGAVWMATFEGGLHRLKDNQLTYYSELQGAPSNQILTIFQDRDGQVWAGSNDNGFFRFIGDHIFHFTEENGLAQNSINGIRQDNNGDYWLISFGGGLTRLSIYSTYLDFRNYDTGDGLPDMMLTGITIAPDGTIWLGTFTEGIVKFDGNRFYNYTEINNLAANQVTAICADSKGIIWIGTGYGLCRFNGEGFWCIEEGDPQFDLINNNVTTIIEDAAGNIWVGTENGLARFYETGAKMVMTDYDEEEGLLDKGVNTLAEDPYGNIWIGTGGGLFRFDVSSDEERPIKLITTPVTVGTVKIESLHFIDKNTLIVATGRGFNRWTLSDDGDIINTRNYDQSDGFTGLENNQNAIYNDLRKRIWFGTASGVTVYQPSLEKESRMAPTPLITGIQLSYKDVDWSGRAEKVTPWFSIPQDLKLPFSQNHLTFTFNAISFSNPEKIRFRYRLLDRDTIWSPARRDFQADYPGLNPGEYTLEISAQNETGTWSRQPARFHFIIKPPFYRTWWFYTLVAILISALILAYIKWRERQLILEKHELEEKVQERTKEIRKQKTKIEEAYTQISIQKELIEQKNLDITSSIEYAKRIQEAILPSGQVLKESLADSFVLYRPKDIVSGDFYWVRKPGDMLVLVAADCTGHGVPGAFMSMLGVSFLDEIVDKEQTYQPARILERLRENVIIALKQKEEMGGSKDGMDIAVVTINLKTSTLEYAGANNPLYLVRNGKLTEVKADRMPVAIHERMEKFTNHTMKLDSGDLIYLFSDGYADQFGGPDGKKFKYKPLKELFVEISKEKLSRQKEILEETFDQWKGGPDQDGEAFEQIDDIVILGCKVK